MSAILDKPLFIAGPCSVETPEQVHSIAQAIAKEAPTVRFLRGGIWKPRTRPDSFEGVGVEGLAWLAQAAKEVGLEPITEVANARHVEKALKAGIHHLWIGARTTVSPFIVQELAEALQGSQYPVYIKNPVNPDVKLWLGAIERVERLVKGRVFAIHRGFSTYGATMYRNPPHWDIPMELRRMRPDLPILCDPSHIAGKRSLIAAICQQAMDLGMNGLMVETHTDPDNAWSDAAQQITPSNLGDMLSHLRQRKDAVQEEKALAHLADIRKEMDEIDHSVLALFGKRMDLAAEIGELKAIHDVAIHQPERWKQVVKMGLEEGRKLGLSDVFILALFQKIHNESISRQIKAFTMPRQ